MNATGIFRRLLCEKPVSAIYLKKGVNDIVKQVHTKRDSTTF